jgi:hypothetical protein
VSIGALHSSDSIRLSVTKSVSEGTEERMRKEALRGCLLWLLGTDLVMVKCGLQVITF